MRRGLIFRVRQRAIGDTLAAGDQMYKTLPAPDIQELTPAIYAVGNDPL